MQGCWCGLPAAEYGGSRQIETNDQPWYIAGVSIHPTSPPANILGCFATQDNSSYLQVKISQCRFKGMTWSMNFKKRSLNAVPVGVMPCLVVTTQELQHSWDSVWKKRPKSECHCLAFCSCLRINWLIQWKSFLNKQISSTGLKKSRVSPFFPPSSNPVACGGRTTGDRVKVKCMNPIHYLLWCGKIILSL